MWVLTIVQTRWEIGWKITVRREYQGELPECVAVLEKFAQEDDTGTDCVYHLKYSARR